jgi:hypothetical protein
MAFPGRKNLPVGRSWGVTSWSDAEEEEEDEEGEGEEREGELATELQQNAACELEYSHRHRTTGTTACGAPKETVHIFQAPASIPGLQQQPPNAPYTKRTKRKFTGPVSASGALSRENQFLVDRHRFKRFRTGNPNAVAAAVPPFSADLDRRDISAMMRWEADSLQRQLELQKDPYYDFARRVAGKTKIALSKLWNAPASLQVSSLSPAWQRELLYEPEEDADDADENEPFELEDEDEDEEGFQTPPVQPGDFDDGDEDNGDSSSLTPIVRTNTPPRSTRSVEISPNRALPLTFTPKTTTTRSAAPAPSSAGASVAKLTESLKNLADAGIKVNDEVIDSVLQKLQLEAAPLTKRERDRRLALADSTSWLSTPTVTGVSLYSDELMSAVNAAHELILTRLFQNQAEDWRPSIDFLIRLEGFREKFAQLTASIIKEEQYETGKRWVRRELLQRVSHRQEVILVWFKRQLAAYRRNVYSTSNSDFLFAMRSVMDTTPDRVVNWMGSGFNPAPAGFTQAGLISNYRAYSGRF